MLKKIFGPSTLIAAAFIGPGTLTTCTIVGVETSYTLLWAMLFAIIATIILQEMSARLGLATQLGLGEALNSHFQKGAARYAVFFLVIGAILIGNAAYEAGNISGGVLGINVIFGESDVWPVVIGGLCILLMYLGGYKWAEKILISLVIIMSICFFITVFMVSPDWLAILEGFIPGRGAQDHFLLIMAVIGTTVVPYNLFLHASTISKKWTEGASIKEVRLENGASIVMGGLISIFIIITAAAATGSVEEIRTAKDLAVQLEPLFGVGAKWFMGVGLMAAGISSALTAPLAAAYAAKGLFGWKGGEKNAKFRAVWMSIIVIGILVSIADIERVLIIKFAQITNAILLPFIAGYLLYMCNSKTLMGNLANGKTSNILGVIVVLLTAALSVKSLSGFI